MGCDIHSMIEVRVEGTWVTATTFAEKEEGNDSTWFHPIDEPVGDRNYSLFAILADVRNGHGFAGIDTGDGYEPMSKPRGVPGDASPEFKQWCEDWGLDGHSHTHHSLSDFFAYDFHRQSVVRGVLTLEVYARWRAYGIRHGGQPDSWCGAVTGPGIEMLTPDGANKSLAQIRNKHGREGHESHRAYWDEVRANRSYVECEWRRPYLHDCGQLWNGAIPTMVKEMRDRELTLDDVRLCMFFDN